MRKIRSLVFVIAAAAALFLGVREPTKVAADAPPTYCPQWFQHCNTQWYTCYQGSNGQIYYCSYNYCFWSYSYGLCGGSVALTGF